MKIICLVFIIALSLFISCKSDDDYYYKIVEPEPYFPAYPNSWWKYLINDSVTEIASTYDNYMLSNYIIGCDPDIYSKKVYVPYISPGASKVWAIYGFIYGYNTLLHLDNWCSTGLLWPFLKTEVGSSFHSFPPSHTNYNDYYENVLVKDKIYNGKDSIIILERQYMTEGTPIDSYKGFQEFTKNIGMTSWVIVDTASNDTLKKIILIDYHISW